MWKELDPAEKTRYLTLERDDKERYQEEMLAYRRQAGASGSTSRSGSPSPSSRVRKEDGRRCQR